LANQELNAPYTPVTVNPVDLHYVDPQDEDYSTDTEEFKDAPSNDINWDDFDYESKTHL